MTLGQDQDSVTQAQEQLVTASTTLEKDYQSGFNTVASTFIDLQNVVTGLQVSSEEPMSIRIRTIRMRL